MLDNKSAIEILENKTGFHIVAEDCDVEVIEEAIQIALESLKREVTT